MPLKPKNESSALAEDPKDITKLIREFLQSGNLLET
jgi:hypothetical protein